jgi:hypothetical protein
MIRISASGRRPRHGFELTLDLLLQRDRSSSRAICWSPRSERTRVSTSRPQGHDILAGRLLPVPEWSAFEAEAARIAEDVHRGQVDADGSPHLDHVRRVATPLAREARVCEGMVVGSYGRPDGRQWPSCFPRRLVSGGEIPGSGWLYAAERGYKGQNASKALARRCGGFRDRPETGYLQGFVLGLASGLASARPRPQNARVADWIGEDTADDMEIRRRHHRPLRPADPVSQRGRPPRPRRPSPPRDLSCRSRR